LEVLYQVSEIQGESAQRKTPQEEEEEEPKARNFFANAEGQKSELLGVSRSRTQPPNFLFLSCCRCWTASIVIVFRDSPKGAVIIATQL
jgi:hypothetical protein